VAVERTSSGAFDLSALRRVFDDNATDVRARIAFIYVLLVGANVAAWVLALAVFHSRPALAAAALLAYTFGLRHAVDADHISAIDNATRKLMQEGRRPVAAGLYFSLGHSTIVVALTVAIALAATTIQRSFPALQNVGGLIGTSVSALFLYAIAAINLVVLLQVIRAFRAVRSGRDHDPQALAPVLMPQGLIGRFCRPLLRLVGRSWHMYPLGMLFGLGFDTATEIGLLGLAAVGASKGLPMLTILIFPLLFTVGMSLIDTTDGILMLGAYGWAFVKPLRKLYYNMSITLASVLVAFLVGTIELFGVVHAQFGLQGPLGNLATRLNANFELLGFVIVGVFVASWGISVAVFRSERQAPEPVPSSQ
jgi:high-affinity nickel-transport protein